MAVTLTSSYQYLGRVGKKSQNGGGSHYILVYAKTVPNNSTGYHRVYVYTKMASNYGTFYGYDTVARGYVGSSQAFSVDDKPSSAWSGKNAIAKANAGGYSYSQSVDLGSGYVDVDCTNCQAKTISIRGYYKFKSAGTTYTPPKNEEFDVTINNITLPAIIRQAKFTTGSSATFTDEGNPVIKYSNPSGDSAAKLQACIARFDTAKSEWTTSGAVGYRDISKTGSSYTFELTDAERENLRKLCPNSNSVALKFYLATTIGTQTFRESIDTTMTITNGNPEATCTISEGDSIIKGILGSDAGSTMILNMSDLQISINPTIKKHATLKSITVTNGNSSETGTAVSPAILATFPKAKSNVVSYTVTDSRNNQYTSSITLKTEPYQPLQIVSSEFKRVSLDTNEVVVNAKIKCFNGIIKDTANDFALSYSVSNNKQGNILDYKLSGTGKDGEILLKNVSLGDSLLTDTEVATFTLQAQDKLSETNEYVTASNRVNLMVATFEAGATDFRVNGDLIIADKKGLNPKNIMEMLYPVGSIYITMDQNFLPGKTFGGTWVQFGAGKTLVGVDSADADFNTVRKMGGHKTIAAHTHSLTINNKTLTGSWKQNKSRFGGTNTVTGIVTNIKESIAGYFNETGGTDTNTVGISINATHNHTGTVGSTGTGNQGNLQPYVTVYMWERTA